MRNEYTVTEVIEIGEAQDVILGAKEGFPPDQEGLIRGDVPDNDLDE
jgi:hypothetical protein